MFQGLILLRPPTFRTYYSNMTYQSLIGKLAPSISLPSYTGEIYNFIPGEKGIPAAIFFYPTAGSL